MKKHTLFIILIMGLALAIGIWRDKQETSAHNSIKQFTNPNNLTVATVLPNPRKIGPFELVDVNGKAFTPFSFEQHWSFVFFGYSNCPDICPTTLTALNDLAQRLKALPAVQYVFISIDPDKDSQEQLKQYLTQDKFKSTPFIGLTGKKGMVIDLAKDMGIAVARDETKATEEIEHSKAVLLVNPQGEIAAIYTNTDNAGAMAKDFREILHHYANAAL